MSRFLLEVLDKHFINVCLAEFAPEIRPDEQFLQV